MSTKSKLRNKGWKQQPEFDRMLSDTSSSGLQFLKLKYEKDIRKFEMDNTEENFREFKNLLQRYNMINEEMKKRASDSNIINDTITFYDSNSDTVVVDHKDTGDVEYYDIYFTENYNVIKSKKIEK